VVAYSDLNADELSWFANNFMLDFAKLSIAIENFNSEPYDCFYSGFWDIFKDFLSKRTSFEVNETLNDSYTYFSKMINGYIPVDFKSDISFSLNCMPDSGDGCISQLAELRALEEG